jgi:hypothetical protein
VNYWILGTEITKKKLRFRIEENEMEGNLFKRYQRTMQNELYEMYKLELSKA